MFIELSTNGVFEEEAIGEIELKNLAFVRISITGL